MTLLRAAEDQLIVDEELAPQHEEEKHAGDDVGEGRGDTHLGVEGVRALLEDGQQGGYAHHGEGVELGQPGHGDGGEARPGGHAGVQGVVGAGDQQEAHHAGDGAGEEHGAHDDPAHVHARVPGGVLASPMTAIS